MIAGTDNFRCGECTACRKMRVKDLRSGKPECIVCWWRLRPHHWSGGEPVSVPAGLVIVLYALVCATWKYVLPALVLSWALWRVLSLRWG